MNYMLFLVLSFVVVCSQTGTKTEPLKSRIDLGDSQYDGVLKTHVS